MPSEGTRGRAPGAQTVGELGEFAMVAQISARLTATSAVLLGPGDDAAVLACPDGRVVATTDVLVEDRHFRQSWSSAYDIGRKAAAQNLADVVAMGARPTALLVGLAVPAATCGDVGAGARRRVAGRGRRGRCGRDRW